MKKLLSILLALSLIFGLCAGMTGSVSADDYLGDEFIVRSNGDGTCELCYSDRSDRDSVTISIPQYINGMRVTAIAGHCFREFKQLETVIIPEGVRSIGIGAFYLCPNLHSIHLPASLTELSPSALSGCGLSEISVDSRSNSFCTVDGVLFTKDMRTLVQYPPKKKATSYTVPRGVTTILDEAFCGSSNLVSITLPETVTALGEGAFIACESLENITIPNSVTQFGDSLFAYCSNLQSFSFPKNMTAITPGMFNECALRFITIPDMVTSIGYAAFFGCTELSSVTLPESLTSIGECAFCNCEQLSSITLPESLTSIGEYAFSGCGELASINLPKSLVSIGEKAFSGCANGSGFNFVIPENVSFVGDRALSPALSISVDSKNPNYCSKDGVLFSKDMTKLIQYPVRSTATNYVIPSSVTVIGNYAFSGANNLNSLSVPDSVVSIGDSAFSYCGNLQNITLPEEVLEFGTSVFSECANLKEVVLPYGVTEIDYGMFEQCSSLTHIVVPTSVWNFSFGSFFKYNNFTNLDYSGTEDSWAYVTKQCDPNEDMSSFITTPAQYTGSGYEDDLFCYVEDGRCGKVSVYNLTDIARSRSLLEVPQEIDGKPVEAVASHTFTGCYNLREAALPEGIVSLGEYAFSGCYNLKKILLPATLASIGESAFEECNALQSISIPEGVTKIPGNAFYNCYNLEQITLPDSLTLIGETSFVHCTSLSSLELPENLQYIGYAAFGACDALKSVTLPNSINEVDGWAFANCTSLRWVYIPTGLAYLGNDIFAECDNLKEIFYQGSYTQWQAIEGTEYLRKYRNATVYFDCNPVVGRFMDVKASDWFKDAVAYVFENELMNGVSDMRFSPSGTLTRGQLVTILYRIAGKPATGGKTAFKDVAAGRYYTDAIKWAAEEGIVTGYSDGTFKPDNKITREQIATILYRYTGSPDVSGLLDFPDAYRAGNYARKALIWATKNGLISGIKSNGELTLSPKSNATRAQIATIIMRYQEADGLDTPIGYAYTDEALADKYNSLIVAKVGNEQLSGALFQIFYWSSVYNYLNVNAEYVPYLGPDTTVPLGDQAFNDEFDTFEDYFIDQALEMYLEYVALYENAKASGTKLDAQSASYLENMEKMLDAEAKEIGFANANDYLKQSYGPGVTVSVYKEYYRIAALAMARAEELLSSIDSDDYYEAYEMYNQMLRDIFAQYSIQTNYDNIHIFDMISYLQS